MSYLQKDREKIINQSKQEHNKNVPLNMALGYNLYDIMRLQLEELHCINETMKLLVEVIQKEQKNR